MSEKLKRLIVITAIFVLALSLALVTVACDKPGTDPKPEPEKQIVRLDAAPSADSDKTVSEGKFVLPEGQAVSFSSSDFAVKAVYSDGSESPITSGFSIDANSIPQNVSAGTYSVMITYGSHSAYVSVEVVTSLTPLPALDDSVEKRFSYEGTPFDLIAELDAQREQADWIETLLSDGKISISTEENLGTRSATDAGDYMLCLVAAPGYAWVDQYGGNVTEKTFRWSIAKKIVPIPTVDGPTTFEYTGQVITLPVNMRGFGDHITLSNGVSETNQEIDANGEDGSYLCYAFIKNEDQNNYVFEGGTVGADVCSWKITPKKVAYPTLSGYQWSETRNGVEYYHYPYTGSEIAVATNLDNDPAFTVRKNAGGLIVDVYPFENGSYFVEIDLADQTKSGNYRWADGTRISAVSLNVVVDPIDYALPSAVSSATLKATADYSSSGSFETIGANAFTEATRDLLADQEVWIDGVSDVTYNDGATYGAGVQTLQFLFKRSQNYKPLPIEIEVTINRAVVNVQSPSWYGPQNTTDSENVYDVGEGNFLYNGLPQRKELDLYYYSYALLDESLYAKVTYDVYYGTEEGVYGETPIAHNVVTSNDYGRYRFAYDGENSAAVHFDVIGDDGEVANSRNIIQQQVITNDGEVAGVYLINSNTIIGADDIDIRGAHGILCVAVDRDVGGIGSNVDFGDIEDGGIRDIESLVIEVDDIGIDESTASVTEIDMVDIDYCVFSTSDDVHIAVFGCDCNTLIVSVIQDERTSVQRDIAERRDRGIVIDCKRAGSVVGLQGEPLRGGDLDRIFQLDVTVAQCDVGGVDIAHQIGQRRFVIRSIESIIKSWI